MDKETLSNYGWVVIAVLVLSVMIALATPFGKYIATAVENTTQGLFDVQQKAMGVAGLVVEDQEFDVPDMNHGAEENGGTPVVKTINFTIRDSHDGITYDSQAKEGMKWGEWVKSEYNTDGFIIQDGYGYITDYKHWAVRDNGSLVYENDVITEGALYEIGGGGE